MSDRRAWCVSRGSRVSDCHLTPPPPRRTIQAPPSRFRKGVPCMAMHPLEPLSAAEVQQAVQILKKNGKVTPTTRFVSISLKEPPKDAVHSGRGSATREAFAVLFDNGTNTAHEATVSLTNSAVLGFKSTTGVQPTMTIDEQIECEQAVLASP